MMIVFLKRILKENKDIKFLCIIFLYALTFELLLRFLAIDKNIIPCPSQIIKDIIENKEYYLKETWASIFIIVKGLFLSVCIGFSLAFLINEFKTVRRLIHPILDASQLLPKTALLPLFLSIPILGYSDLSKVTIVFLISFYPIYIDTLFGLNKLPKHYSDYFQILSANRWQTFIYLKFPYVLPFSFNGLKTSVLYAVVGAITSEIMIGMKGIGYVIDYSVEKLNFIHAYSGIVISILIGWVLIFCIDVSSELKVIRKYGLR